MSPESIRVLTVDDNRAARMITSIVLRSASMSVTETTSGGWAIAELDERPDFDAIVADLHMADGSGVEFVRAVRARTDRAADVPIIVLATQSYAPQAEAATAAGADMVLTKPFRPDDLVGAIRSRVAARRHEPPSSGLAVDALALLDAFPFPAMILDAERTVLIGNAAYYELTDSGVDDRHVCCFEEMHADGEVAAGCPFEGAVACGRMQEGTVLEPGLGQLHVTVYPLDRSRTQGRQLYLHIARPVESAGSDQLTAT